MVEDRRDADIGFHADVVFRPDAAARMDAVFHALASDPRRRMLHRLAAGALTVSELAEPLDMSLAAASKHVKVLERAGLLHRTVDGRRHVCRLEAGPLAAADEWLRLYEPLWEARLEEPTPIGERT
ncbi:ArsR/SmtB family transcription factor [Actinomadura macrotermitis]|uniref:HTH arsR-type domain-containing protein n=1 Tax=Actinomadura macrotermitis TaxID=2585200 RepID=A0A7K0BX96_9ACTN|nr:metalloregulator ArsR/SmtB family transcription factor [Actinomadura macrotermitis]MQY05805.1 hypothetical protein [Actinomadura macrotermitis]